MISIDTSPCSFAPHSGPVESGTSLCSAVAASTATPPPPWLAATLTVELQVCLHFAISVPADLRNCRGVSVKKSSPQYARVLCDNAQELTKSYGQFLSLPLRPQYIVSSDVSCRSNANTLSYYYSTRKSTVNGRRAISVARVTSKLMQQSLTQEPKSGAGGLQGGSASPDAGEQENDNYLMSETCSNSQFLAGRVGVKNEDASPELASLLPTFAAIITSKERGGRALLVVRPSIAIVHQRSALVYHASLRLLSSSICLVQISQIGDVVLVLPEQLTATSENEAVVDLGSHSNDLDRLRQSSTSAVAEIGMRGGYFPVEMEEDFPKTMYPLCLWALLSIQHRRDARDVARILSSRIVQFHCRPAAVRPVQPVNEYDIYGGGTGRYDGAAAPQPGLLSLGKFSKVEAAGLEMVLRGSDGHVLVFRLCSPPLPPGLDGSQNRAFCTTFSFSGMLVYQCCYLSRLFVVPPMHRDRGSHGGGRCRSVALLMAPPWSFSERWRHSNWFIEAVSGAASLETQQGSRSSGTAALLPDRRSRRRKSSGLPHRIVAMSPNGRLWLLQSSGVARSGEAPSLYLAVIPTTSVGNEMSPNALQIPVMLESGVCLHDAHFIDTGEYAGFLLLCLRWPPADGGAVPTSPGRFHYMRRKLPLEVFFMPLLSGTVTAARLYFLPWFEEQRIWTGVPAAFFHSSCHLRFAATTTSARHPPMDTALFSPYHGDVYFAIASSAAPLHLVIGTATLPTLDAMVDECIVSKLGVGAETISDTTRAMSLAAFSAVLPFPFEVASGVQWSGGAANGLAASSTNVINGAGDRLSLEATMEIVLLRLSDPSFFQKYTSTAFFQMLCRTIDAVVLILVAPPHPQALEEGGALLTVLFEGFTTALLSGGLFLAGGGDAEGAGPTSPSFSPTLFCYYSTQILRRALDRVSSLGDMSVVLACLSHLAVPCSSSSSSTAATAAAGGAASGAAETRDSLLGVWYRLLQPLFDAVVSLSLTTTTTIERDLLVYCSPPMQEMLRIGRQWLNGSCREAIEAPAVATGKVRRDAVSATDEISNGQPPMSLHPPLADVVSQLLGSGATSSSSSHLPSGDASQLKLRDVLRRVFLSHGSAAAVDLIHNLSAQEPNRPDLTELAMLYDSYHHRLSSMF